MQDWGAKGDVRVTAGHVLNGPVAKLHWTEKANVFPGRMLLACKDSSAGGTSHQYCKVVEFMQSRVLARLSFI